MIDEEINPIVFFSQHLAFQHLTELYFLFALSVPFTSEQDKLVEHWINFWFVGLAAIIYWTYMRKLIILRYKLRKIKPNMTRELTIAEKRNLKAYLKDFTKKKHIVKIHLAMMVLAMLNACGADYIDNHKFVTMNATIIVISYVALLNISLDIPHAAAVFFPFAIIFTTFLTLSLWYRGVFTFYRAGSLFALILSSIWIAFVMSLDKRDCNVLTARYDPVITPFLLEADPSLSRFFVLRAPLSSSSPQIPLDDYDSSNSPDSPDSNDIKFATSFKNSISDKFQQIWEKLHPVGEHFIFWLDSIQNPYFSFF